MISYPKEDTLTCTAICASVCVIYINEPLYIIDIATPLQTT